MRHTYIAAASLILLTACGSDTEEPQVVPSDVDVEYSRTNGRGEGSRCQGPCEEDAGGGEEDGGDDAGAGDTGRAQVSTGEFVFSHDWTPEQGTDFIGEDDTTLFDVSCEPIAVVSEAFAEEVYAHWRGGRLADGVSIETAGCACAITISPEDQPSRCFETLDKDVYPWGKGPYDRPLTPLRSVGTDQNVVELGTSVFIPKWEGVVVPSIGGVEGFVHDGCFVADDWMGSGWQDVSIFYGSLKMSDYFLEYFGPDIFGDVTYGDARCP